MGHYHPDIILGDHTSPKLIIFQIMHPRFGRVVRTVGVWDVAVKPARLQAQWVRDRYFAGCPMPWRESYLPGRDDEFLREWRERTAQRG